MKPFRVADVSWMQSQDCEFDEGRCAGVIGPLEGESVADLRRSLRSSLDQPLGFPPIRTAVVPGDHVVIALSHGASKLVSIVSLTIEFLVDCDVDVADVTLLFPPLTDIAVVEGFQGRLADLGHELSAFKIHDPSDEGSIAFLTVTARGEPVVCNRDLAEADLVIPVQVISGAQGAGDFDTLFSMYAGQSSDERGSKNHNPSGGMNDLREEFPQLIGAFFGLFAVPGFGGGIVHVQAGEYRETRERAIAVAKQQWVFEIPEDIDLVIANLADFGDYSWQGLRHAIDQSVRAVGDHGKIAIRISECSDSSLVTKQLVENSSSDESVFRLVKGWIDRVGEDKRLFLMSAVDEEVADQLGMGYIGSIKQLSRLANAHESWLLITDAGRCRFVTATSQADV